VTGCTHQNELELADSCRLDSWQRSRRVHGPQAACATAVEIRSHSYRAGDPACKRWSARARIGQSEGQLAFARRRRRPPRHR